MSLVPEPAPVVTRPSLRQLIALAWPVVITRSAQAVVGFTDAAMVAHLGEEALAATTTGAMNTFTILILPMGVVFIVSSFSSQLTGKGDAAGARRFGFYGLGVAVLAGVVGLASWPFVDDALSVFSYDEGVRSLMTSYLQLRLLSAGFAIGLEALGAYYNGLGNTRLPMLAQIAAMLLNVFFNWVLIFGHLGAQAMGVAGAAIASSIATTLAFAGLLACFLLGVGQGGVHRSPLRRDEMWRTLRFGLPSGLNWFIEFAAFTVFMNVVVAGLGTTTLAAFMSVLQLNSMSFMPAFAIASAGSIFVGQAIGAKKHDDVPRTLGLTFKTAMVWMGVVGLAYLLIPGLLLDVFVQDGKTSAEFVEAGKRMLMLSALWQGFDAAGMTLSEALRAAGDTSFTFWARAVIAWGLFVPGAWISVRVFGFGDVAATLALVAYLGLLATALYLRFRTGRWRTIELTADAAGVPPHA
jgi:MATE family multidrug resistance protein